MRTDDVLDVLITAGLGNGIGDGQKISGLLSGMTDEEWDKLWRWSELHQIWGVVYAGISAYPDAEIPDGVRRRFISAGNEISYQYCYMLSFTTWILDILEKEHIKSYVLKGISLNSLYPEEGMRKLADVDIYIPEQSDFQRADSILKAQGFRPQMNYTDIHNGYIKEMGGRNCLLELHWKPAERLADLDAEREAERIFEGLEYRPDQYRVSGVEIPALPPTEYALQLLLHMFQHFVHAGFGLRMLCDWCVFWKHKGKETDGLWFLSCLKRMRLAGFAWAVTQACVRHLGLPPETAPWMSGLDGSLYGNSAEALWNDMMDGGEFGKGEKSRMVIFQNHSFLGACVREVHNMMRIRFPRFRACVPAWPFLWTATILIFLKNNRKLDRGGMKDIIESARSRKELLKKMKVFKT